MSRQLVLTGPEGFIKPEWNPRPGTLARLKTYLEGFAAHGRAIYARRKHIAAKLKIGLRTLDRYLAHLTKSGWLETLKRTARTAVRAVSAKVSACLPGSIAGTGTGESTGESIEVKPEASQNPLTQNSCNTPCSVGAPKRACEPQPTPKPSVERPAEPLPGAALEIRNRMPVGYDPLFQEYVGIPLSAGKAMNSWDIKRAHGVWCGKSVEDRVKATQHYRDLCLRTADPRFIPMPVSHLLDEGWTRVAQERTLPLIQDRIKGRTETLWDEFMSELRGGKDD